jgi:Icc-related predicted phosphoesterase
MVIPKCDLLIHAGDIAGKGSFAVIRDFNDWIGELKSSNVVGEAVVIPGNHDLSLDPVKVGRPCNDAISLFTNCELLIDAGIELNGIKIWGSPYTPAFMDWAFNKKRGQELREQWEKIPENLDILITHGPPYGIQDKAMVQHLGDIELYDAIVTKSPRVHIFGHIHGGYGIAVGFGTLFVNASLLDEDYHIANQPIVFTI